MVDRSRKPSPKNPIINERFIHFVPVGVPTVVVILMLLFLVIPAILKLVFLNREIQTKKNEITMAERGQFDLKNYNAQIAESEKKLKEFETRLPQRIKTNLLIETLQDITKRTKMKFTSLDPLPIKRHVHKETKSVFVELPVRAKLNCGFYEFLEFLKQMESAAPLMRVGEMSLKDDPSNDWDHVIEVQISAFSKGEDGE